MPIVANLVLREVAIIYYFTPRVTIHDFNPFYMRFSKIEMFQAFIYKLQSYFINGLLKSAINSRPGFPDFS